LLADPSIPEDRVQHAATELRFDGVVERCNPWSSSVRADYHDLDFDNAVCAYYGGSVMPEAPAEMAEIISRLDRIEKLMTLNVVKEAYSVEDVAERLGNAIFTVRQWCNKGHIRATKTRGVGKRGSWRISAEELARVQEHGPSPEYTFDNHAEAARAA
jgi:excisionase family DNA binding protein